MPHYAIGDVQGCYDALMRLLEKIHFDPLQDTLWFTGDLVNRGPASLETLRFIKSLGERHRIVLGNHDLHLLAVALKAHASWKEDTFDAVLKAKDRDELIEWLKTLPLLYHDESLNYTMVHAGLAPQWDLKTAKKLSSEVEAILKSDEASLFLKNMYGNEPAAWRDDLKGFDRLRCITNFLTRARFCDVQGTLELSQTDAESEHAKWMPWFQVPHRKTSNNRILFGHWAALGGITHTPNVFALDTGCVWGFCLTAMRLSDEVRFTVSCRE